MARRQANAGLFPNASFSGLGVTWQRVFFFVLGHCGPYFFLLVRGV